MHAWPHVHLFRTPGREGDPWMWVVTLGQGKEAARLELRWNVGGRPCTTPLDRLDAGQAWTHPSYLEPSIQAIDICNHLGSVSIEWVVDAQRAERLSQTIDLIALYFADFCDVDMSTP
jgi:hypothetical protein